MKCVYSILVLLTLVNTVFAAETESGPNTESSKVVSIFNDIKSPGEFSFSPGMEERLVKSWFQMPVTKKNGMFNPVFLPFKYSSKTEDGDELQPLTFPCLLSFKFDFVPDNFSARHPGFTFRRKPIWLTQLEETEKVVDYIKYWEATHAIGGSITQLKDGYTGELVVVNEFGKEIVHQEYTKPVPYFTLMGEMVKTWMDYRYQPVSDALYKELTLPMTTNMECVRLYSTSFKAKWRTQDEWDIYDKILKLDPDFAEVRFWYANQKTWSVEDDRDEIERLKIEKGKALTSHLVMPALREFDYIYCKDKKLIKECKKVVEYAADVCAGNPSILAVKLEYSGNEMSMTELGNMRSVAEQYPCSWNFLKSYANAYRKRGVYEMSMPLFLSAIKSGYLKGNGSFAWEWGLLSIDYYRLGYYEEAIYCGAAAMKYDGLDSGYHLYLYLGMAFKDQNDFVRAAPLLKLANDKDKGQGGGLLSRMCIYQDGNLSLLEDRNYTTEESSYVYEKARKEVAKGDYDKALELMAKSVKDPVLRKKRKIYDFESEIICSDIYCLTGDLDKAKKHAVRAWYIRPQSKQVAYLLGKCMNDNKIEMERYLKAAAKIFKDDKSWEALANELGVSLEKEPYENVIEVYNEIKKELDGVSEDAEWGYWQKFSPFEIEYICLYLVQYGDNSMRENAIALYCRYQETVEHISTEQMALTRMFYLRLNDLEDKLLKQ